MPDIYRGRTILGNDLRMGEVRTPVRLSGFGVQQDGLAAFNNGEPLLGCGSQIVLPKNYLKEAYRYIRNAGALCITDGSRSVWVETWGFETKMWCRHCDNKASRSVTATIGRHPPRNPP